ncbi:prion-like-(Q/N-rich) domain-bearing protein 25 [Littorina saxatilis]|uniref:prion-like-(Q/N-rich) domain-bearing protein 25 n=1 Tax=Littorina saxatilis TaxID=31220 RepID=UPI0038B61024
MAKLILASVLCIFLLVKGTEAQAPGEDCGTADACDPGATCETPKCMANLGQTCSDTIDCVTGATCEDTTCKKNAGTSDCTDSGTTLCVSTATCENTKCVANLGESCEGSINCVTDTDCDTTDSTCRTKVTKAGSACSEKTTFCDPTTLTCDGENCKIQVNQSCAATTECTAYAECDTTCTCKAPDYTAASGVCVGTKTLGEECANDNCAPGFVCDGGKCKNKFKEAGNDCSATVTDKACDPTTLACQDGKCKWKIEQVCTATDQCVAGATCEGSGTTKQCSCPVGVSPSSDKAQCGGAMGIATSMLLVVATFVTSRFL